MIRIRRFVAGDATACRAIYATGLREALPHHPLPADNAEFLAETEGETILVAVGRLGGVRGFCSVFEPDAFIHMLYVRRRDRRRGVGRALLDAALTIAGPSATLKCARDNKSALAFYNRVGWRQGDHGIDGEGAWVRLHAPEAK